MKTYSRLMDGWFSEICPMWPGVSLSLKIKKVLYSKKSKFQQIDMFQTENHGKMLVLDGIIQLTQSDEFAYHEMLVHVPLFAHTSPEDILVIGGGDGGVLREVSRHKCVKNIDFCEIDEDVIKVCKKFLPDLACGFDDPRVNVHIADGSFWVQEHRHQYDVIIVDSSDPIGPGEVLFERPFYEGLKGALKPNGIVATQGESFFMHQECVVNLAGITKKLFPIHAYSYFLVPTYPGGNIGVCLGSLGYDVKAPNRDIPVSVQTQLKYYCSEIHKASFVLPYFAKELFRNI